MEAAIRLYTVAEANRTLPLVSVILSDIAERFVVLEARRNELAGVRDRLDQPGQLTQDEFESEVNDFQRDVEQFQKLIDELTELGVELKDPRVGLVDFRSFREDRIVYLCWKLGEERIDHWHEIDAGFSGRQSIEVEESSALVNEF